MRPIRQPLANLAEAGTSLTSRRICRSGQSPKSALDRRGASNFVCFTLKTY